MIGYPVNLILYGCIDSVPHFLKDAQSSTIFNRTTRGPWRDGMKLGRGKTTRFYKWQPTRTRDTGGAPDPSSYCARGTLVTIWLFGVRPEVVQTTFLTAPGHTAVVFTQGTELCNTVNLRPRLHKKSLI